MAGDYSLMREENDIEFVDAQRVIRLCWEIYIGGCSVFYVSFLIKQNPKIKRVELLFLCIVRAFTTKVP